MKKVKYRAEGIVCSGCAMDMETVLNDTDGVVEASVRYADGLIEIEFDPEEIDEDALFARVEKLGFKTKVVG